MAAENGKTVAVQDGPSMWVTRRFAAPRESVFDLCSDPDHITNWWGPVGFSTSTQAFDFRPGGVWKHVMHGPDWQDYDNEVVYREIVRPERIAYSHASPPPFDAVLTFAAVGGDTELTFHMTFPSTEMRKAVAEARAADGLRDTVDRLNDYITGDSDGSFVISHTVDAPRDRVWAAWTDEKALATWFGPKGVETISTTMDFRVGGTFHFGMRTPDGNVMYGKWVFRAIEPRRRLVWVHSFADADGKVARHPMSPTWPAEMLTTVSFDEQDGKTTVTVRWTPIKASVAERKTFTDGKAGMGQGWGGTFERLDAFLTHQYS